MKVRGLFLLNSFWSQTKIDFYLSIHIQSIKLKQMSQNWAKAILNY